MAELLANETKALQGIQKLRMNARDELQADKTQQMLEKMARPHQWQLSRGEVAHVHTPETQRAQELLRLFQALNQPLLSAEQRLDVLLNVKVSCALNYSLVTIARVILVCKWWHHHIISPTAYCAAIAFSYS